MMEHKHRTVFLSSTSRDLAHHRDVVSQAVGQLENWRCDAMDSWPASTTTSADEIQRHIERCDLFVGLIGHIHGSVPPDSGEEKSFAELEYELATELGKPCLMFVARDAFAIPAEFRESDSKHRAVQALARPLAGQPILAP